MKDYIITFGHGQEPGIGTYIKIPAESMQEARRKIFAITDRWAFIYDSEAAAGVKKFKLREISCDKLVAIYTAKRMLKKGGDDL